tara:strand:+ start:95 stop:1063 length:969 start_codon:yes stop_codon:yes gene_type:complete
MKYSGLIIGLGQIGMGYDYKHAPEKYILTHAQAIQAHPDFELIGGVDISSKSREKFGEKFNKPTFTEINAVKSTEDVDIVVVSVPTEIHLETINNIATQFSPKLILIEKPLSFLFEESQKIVRILKEKNVPIAVNYIREYEPAHRKIFEKIKSNELGYPLKAVCWYSKGLINSGSHFIQLLSNFMGAVIEINIINGGRRWDGFDPEPSLELIYEKGHAYLLPVAEENYSLFEMELIGPKGKIKYYNGGSHYDWWHVNTDTVFNEYKKLEAEPLTTNTKMNKYQYYVYNNIAEYFEGNSDLHCDGKAAFKTAQVLDKIQQKLN